MSNVMKYIAIGCGVVSVILILLIMILKVVDLIKYKNLLEQVTTHCTEYEKLACEHKLPEKPPAGREDSNEGLFPHMAFIVDKNNPNLTCAGTLISDRFVLTANRCIKNVKTPRVKLGSVTSKQNDTGEWFDVIHKHSIMGAINEYNVAILQLARPVQFNPYIRPICLTFEWDITVENPTASGWSKDESDPSFQRLRVVDLNIGSFEVLKQCNHLRRTNLDYWSFDCAELKFETKPACPRSIGGPVQHKTSRDCPNTYLQRGIITEDVFSTCINKTEGSALIAFYELARAIPNMVGKVWSEEGK